MTETSYILRQGDDAARRLALLSEAKWPSTKTFFDRLPITPGMRCLDVGCGTGMVSLELAKRVAPAGSVMGIDTDRVVLQGAKDRAQLASLPAEFCRLDVIHDTLPTGFDLAYARFLLTHLQDPLETLKKIRSSLVSGGLIVIEDIDFDGHVCYPPSPTFDKYIALYKAVARHRSCDPLIGLRLVSLLEEAGYKDIEIDVATPTFHRGPGKMVAAITMEHIREAIVGAKLASDTEIDVLVADLTTLAQRPDSILSLARVFQVVGQAP